LIASFLEQHVHNGGVDDVAEVLLGFLRTYGKNGAKIVKNNCVSCALGVADLGGGEFLTTLHSTRHLLTLCHSVYKLKLCFQLFGTAYGLIIKRLLDTELDSPTKFSILSLVIDAKRLSSERESIAAKSKLIRFYGWKKEKKGSNTSRSRKSLPPKRKEDFRPKNEFTDPYIQNYRKSRSGEILATKSKSQPTKSTHKERKRQKRSEIISHQKEILQRATKNRKNKKKQQRDQVLREFAISVIH